jgi:hypothetical protein
MGGNNTIDNAVILNDFDMPATQTNIFDYFKQFDMFAERCFKKNLRSKSLEVKQLYILQRQILDKIDIGLKKDDNIDTKIVNKLLNDDPNFYDPPISEANVVRTYNIALRLLASAIHISNETELEVYGNLVEQKYGMRGTPNTTSERELIRNTLYDLEGSMLKNKWVKYKHLDEYQPTPTTMLILGKSYSYYTENDSSILFKRTEGEGTEGEGTEGKGTEGKGTEMDLSRENQYQLGKYKKYYIETFLWGGHAEGMHVYQFEKGSLHSYYEPTQGNMNSLSGVKFTRLP